MGFVISEEQFTGWIAQQREKCVIYAPKRFCGGGNHSDADSIRYGEIREAGEIVFDQKAEYSFKEVLTPVSQTLFYFSQEACYEAEGPKKGVVLFLRSCDIHALQRLDEMYLHNGPADFYYARLRENLKIVLMGCAHSFENCFCVSMGTNCAEGYDMAVNAEEDGLHIDCKDAAWNEYFLRQGCERQFVVPNQVHQNDISVEIGANLNDAVMESGMWREYDSRCIACGRCNFVCPTCTCFTMQDVAYDDSKNLGERRRVWASCMVDGFTNVAGGESYRKKNGQRMRFKVLHKVLDYPKRYGHPMCVGCGRCDDICPEYISFSACVNQLSCAMEEVSEG